MLGAYRKSLLAGFLSLLMILIISAFSGYGYNLNTPFLLFYSGAFVPFITCYLLSKFVLDKFNAKIPVVKESIFYLSMVFGYFVAYLFVLILTFIIAILIGKLLFFLDYQSISLSNSLDENISTMPLDGLENFIIIAITNAIIFYSVTTIVRIKKVKYN